MNLKLSNTSNMVFLFPIIIAFLASLWLGLILNLGLLIASFSYHNSFERKYLRIDMFFSWACVIYNLYLCYLFNFNIWPFGLAILFLIVGLYSYFKKKKDHYDIYHMLWHLSSAAITTCCFLGYILYR